jgi:recombination associated protein RdgC
MGAWLALGDAPLRFTIDQDLELQAADKSKAAIRYVRHPLDGKEIRVHLSAGMTVTRLGLTWNDRIAFVLTEKLLVKRVEFLFIDKDKPDGEGEGQRGKEEQFDIDFTLMTGELARMLGELGEALGAQTPPQAVAA